MIKYNLIMTKVAEKGKKSKSKFGKETYLKWYEMMGPTITKYTKSINLRKTTLYITIESAALKQELSFSKEKIKDRMNEELGEEHIQTVVIR